MASIDFKAFRGMVRMEDVIRLIGVDRTYAHESSPRGPCPLHCHWEVRCCRYNWQAGLWYCHRCHRGGTPAQLYSISRGIPIFQAAVELCTLLGLQVPWKARSNVRQPRKPRERRKSVADDE